MNATPLSAVKISNQCANTLCQFLCDYFPTTNNTPVIIFGVLLQMLAASNIAVGVWRMVKEKEKIVENETKIENGTEDEQK